MPYILLLITAGAVGGQIQKIKKEDKKGLSQIKHLFRDGLN